MERQLCAKPSEAWTYPLGVPAYTYPLVLSTSPMYHQALTAAPCLCAALGHGHDAWGTSPLHHGTDQCC